jgi:NAD(P)-dependent dehydrogenase (short-subunit alcohol dehydrogenase family)
MPVALVTGGSAGLGRALAHALAGDGWRVIVDGRDAERLASAVTHPDIVALPGDITDADHRRALVAAVEAEGRLDLLVHNASTLGPTPLRLLLDTDCEDLERVLSVNLVGPFRLTRALAGSMALRGEGLIVHVTSDAAVSPYPRWGAYGVSKAALDHLGRIWAAELEGTGVRFLTVDPGEMDTRMHAEAMPDADPRALLDPTTVAQRILAMIRAAETIPSGARLEASAWKAAPPVRAAS